jgi:hypothetical protein
MERGMTRFSEFPKRCNARRNALERKKGGAMADTEDLRAFFEKRGEKEQGKEPDWDEHKRLITQGMKDAGPQS